jgi:hypothetical protein
MLSFLCAHISMASRHRKPCDARAALSRSAGRESQVCVRRPNGDVVLERRIGKDFLQTLEPEPSRVILETCAEAFAVSISAILTYAPELSPGPFPRSAAWAWD